MRLSFVWWNTSLSPAGKARATDELRQFVCSMVDFILNKMKVDFLALGEIAEKDVKVILENCQLANIGNVFDFAKAGRSRFDTGFLYRRDKLGLIDPPRSIITNKGNSTLKLAQRADFTIRGCDKSLHVFISHWPSLLWCPESSADRHFDCQWYPLHASANFEYCFGVFVIERKIRIDILCALDEQHD